MAIPLACLNINLLTPPGWGINIGRNLPRYGESACIAVVPQVDFHMATHYPRLIWPDVELFKPYCWDVDDLKIVPDKINPEHTSLQGQITNRTEHRQTIVVKIKTVSDVKTSQQLTIEPDEVKDFGFALPRAQQKAELPVTVELLDAQSGQIVGVMKKKALTVKLLEAYIERSYYTSEETAVLVVEAKGSSDVLSQRKLNLIVQDTAGENVVWKKSQVGLSPCMDVAIPIVSLANGQYRWKLSLVNKDGRLLEESSGVFRKSTGETGETKIDHRRRCLLVDGKPTFVFAPLVSMDGGPPEADIERVITEFVESGYDTAVIPGRATSWEQIFKTSSRLKLKLIAWPGWGFPMLDAKGKEKPEAVSNAKYMVVS